MTTAGKRAEFEKNAPKQLKKVFNLIEKGEYRQLDTLVNTWNDTNCISYVITLLCDELVSKDRELNGHSVDQY
jgi:hypothetical protein